MRALAVRRRRFVRTRCSRRVNAGEVSAAPPKTLRPAWSPRTRWPTRRCRPEYRPRSSMRCAAAPGWCRRRSSRRCSSLCSRCCSCCWRAPASSSWSSARSWRRCWWGCGGCCALAAAIARPDALRRGRPDAGGRRQAAEEPGLHAVRARRRRHADPRRRPTASQAARFKQALRDWHALHEASVAASAEPAADASRPGRSRRRHRDGHRPGRDHPASRAARHPDPALASPASSSEDFDEVMAYPRDRPADVRAAQGDLRPSCSCRTST